MKAYYDHAGIQIFHGDARDVLPQLPSCSLILTDPPYGIGLDYGVYQDTIENVYAIVRDIVPQCISKSQRMLLVLRRIRATVASG